MTLLDRGEFVVERGVTPPLSMVAAVLASEFEVVHEPPRSVARTWLDTFDWRLFRAGLTLEHLEGTGSAELVLSTVAGRQVARSPANGLTWPARVNGSTPAGVAQRLAPVLGVRALLPVARTTATLTGLRMLNRDEKTVVRAVVEERTVLSPAAGRLAPRVILAPVRGYDRQAKLALRLLRHTAGIARVGATELDEALAAAARRPGDYPGMVEVTLSASATAGSALASVLVHVLDVLEANVDGVVRDLDTEFLHDLRIAVRRTRSGLTLAGDALPDGMAELFAGEFRWLGHLSTQVRDLDAGLEGLDAAVLEFGPAERGALEPFRRYLERRRAAAFPELVAGLRSPRFTELVTSWRTSLADLPLLQVNGERTAAQLATARISRGYHRILRPGKAITPTSPAEDLHELRKRCKELRYVLEFFASLHPPVAHRAMIKELKSLQDCLGRFQDSQIQREAITFHTEQMAGESSVAPTTLDAMEQLAARLATQQHQARHEFAGRFKRFASPKTIGLLMALAEPPPG